MSVYGCWMGAFVRDGVAVNAAHTCADMNGSVSKRKSIRCVKKRGIDREKEVVYIP